MRSALNKLLAATAVTVVTVASANIASAQDAPQAWDPDYEPPRMADGTPSFAGVWSKASLTVLERTPQFSDLVIAPAVARAIENGQAMAIEASQGPTDPNAPPPEAGQDVGGYNTFWMDMGERIGVVNGEYRSSWIVDPADGKVPYSENGQNALQAAIASRTFDDPEARSAGERCTVGFGSSGGPPMLNVLYNNHVQFFQTADVVSILVEMNHNARMIRLNETHRAPEMQQWLGDSIGHWEGDTLVMETTNFHPDNLYRGAIRHRILLEEDTIVEERFTRVADDVIFYEFTVNDPDLFTQPWRGEMPLWAAEGPIYEYACHEGNYSLPGILAGARREERLAAEENENGTGGQ